jgi:hypothetical protein
MLGLPGDLCDGLRAPLGTNDTVLRADSPWAISCWVRFAEAIKSPTLVGLGETTEEYPRYLSIDAKSLSLWMGKDNSLSGQRLLHPANGISWLRSSMGRNFGCTRTASRWPMECWIWEASVPCYRWRLQHLLGRTENTFGGKSPGLSLCAMALAQRKSSCCLNRLPIFPAQIPYVRLRESAESSLSRGWNDNKEFLDCILVLTKQSVKPACFRSIPIEPRCANFRSCSQR